MSGEQGRILELLREVSLNSSELQVRGLYESQRANLRLLGYGELRGPSSRSALEDFAYEATRLSLEHYNNLLKLSAQHFDRLAGEVGRAVPGAGRAADLTLKAICEGRRAAHALVVIENPHAQPEDVTFSQVGFQIGGKRFTAAVTATRVDGTGGVSLEARESGEFKLEFAADTDFPPGERVCGRVRAFVGDAYVGQLLLEVDVPPAGAAARKGRAKKESAKPKLRSKKK